MRLKEIIAEHYYNVDTDYKPAVPFSEQDSNVRDFYFKVASDNIMQLMCGYLSNKGEITKLIRGSIQDFVNSHGANLNKGNAESLTKRIMNNLRKLKSSPD